MDKRYQVFVSSTYRDLKEERQAIVHALLDIDAIPAGMEMFPASNEGSWALIQKAILASDYYVLIVAGRYGSVDASGSGYTEREYDFAIKSGVPVLAFLHSDPEQIAAGRSERTAELQSKLEAFRAKVQSGRNVNFWSNDGELKTKIISSLHRAFRDIPRAGWVRTKEVQAQLTKALEAGKARGEPQEEVKGLAQGSDELQINVTVKLFRELPGRFEQSPKRLEYVDSISVNARTTWDAVFKSCAAIMLGHPAEESQIHAAIASHVVNLPVDNGRRVVASRTNQFVVPNSEFQRIKLQFHQLGYIVPSEGRLPTQHGRFWALTACGESRLSMLGAARRA